MAESIPIMQHLKINELIDATNIARRLHAVRFAQVAKELPTMPPKPETTIQKHPDSRRKEKRKKEGKNKKIDS